LRHRARSALRHGDRQRRGTRRKPRVEAVASRAVMGSPHLSRHFSRCRHSPWQMSPCPLIGVILAVPPKGSAVLPFPQVNANKLGHEVVRWTCMICAQVRSRTVTFQSRSDAAMPNIKLRQDIVRTLPYVGDGRSQCICCKSTPEQTEKHNRLPQKSRNLMASACSRRTHGLLYCL